jgi:hypothetical protein
MSLFFDIACKYFSDSLYELLGGDIVEHLDIDVLC